MMLIGKTQRMNKARATLSSLLRCLAIGALFVTSGCATQSTPDYIVDLNNRIAAIGANVAALQDSNKKQISQISNLAASLDDIKRQADETKAALAVLQNGEQQQAQKLDTLASSVSEFKQQGGARADTRQSEGEIKGKLDSVQAAVATLASSVNDAKMQIATLKTNLQSEVAAEERGRATLSNNFSEIDNRFLCAIAILQQIMKVNATDMGDTIAKAQSVLDKLRRTKVQQGTSNQKQGADTKVDTVSEYCSKVTPSSLTSDNQSSESLSTPPLPDHRIP